MARPLGKRQWEVLEMLASPTMFCIVGDKVIESVARRGLIAARGDDGKSFYQITPAGMRFLADAWEAGEREYSVEMLKRKPAPKAED